MDELERLGISTGYQTFLVASGLSRRTSQRELEGLVTPELARRFHGNVVVYDVEDPELVALDDSSQPPLRLLSPTRASASPLAGRTSIAAATR